MDAYMYAADLYCSDCAAQVRDGLTPPASADLSDEPTYDSGDWPKGPYPDGGGEADIPQHCAGCGDHLENPLTDEGAGYVLEAMLGYLFDRHGDPKVLATWASYYGDDVRRVWCTDDRDFILDSLSDRLHRDGLTMPPTIISFSSLQPQGMDTETNIVCSGWDNEHRLASFQCTACDWQTKIYANPVDEADDVRLAAAILHQYHLGDHDS